MASVYISTARRRFTRVRLPDSCLTGNPRRFPICSLPGSLSPRSVGWLEDWSCNPSSEGLPPSSMQHDADQLVIIDLRSSSSWHTFQDPQPRSAHADRSGHPKSHLHALRPASCPAFHRHRPRGGPAQLRIGRVRYRGGILVHHHTHSATNTYATPRPPRISR